MVVNLDDQIRSPWNRERRFRFLASRVGARCPAAERTAGRDSRTTDAAVTAALGTLRQAPSGASTVDVDDRVVHDALVAGTELEAADVHIAIEIERQHEAAEIVGAVGSHVVRVAHAHDLIGLTGLPAIREAGWH